MKRIDLHVHTTASDGTTTPSEAVCLAKELGLRAIAVTDHDSCDGVSEALKAGEAYGIEVVPGIELSIDYQGYGIHLLGYFLDERSGALRALLDWVIDERERRNAEMAAAFRADGIDISIPALRALFPDSVIGRPHFAAALVQLGLAETVNDAFNRYLSRGTKYYRKRQYIPMEKAFEVIRVSGGKAVFAHPLQYRMREEELLCLTETLRAQGIVGMECRYHGYTPEQVAYLESLARRFDLCITGGSDFHGSRKTNKMGEPEVDYALLEELKRR